LAKPAFDNFTGDVAGEDAPHAVIAESLAGFVAYDVFDLWRPAVRGRIWFSSHAFGSSAYVKMGPMSRLEDCGAQLRKQIFRRQISYNLNT
jgi:hypothetical protein